MGAVRPEEIYEALFDDEVFNRLPSLLARAGNGRSALLHWRHSTGTYETLAYDHFTPELIADYDQTFRDLDPWVHAVLGDGRRNVVINMDRALPAPYFENSFAYNECIRVHGDDTMHCIATVMETPWGDGLLGVHRGRNGPNFEDVDVHDLQAAVDVLRRVLQVRGEIIAHRGGRVLAQAALDAMGQAAIIVAGDGRILQTNAASETVLRREDGLKVRDRLLACATHQDTVALSRLLTAATTAVAPMSGAVVIERGPDPRPPYLLTVTPLIGRPGRAAALLVFRDPDAVDDTLADRLRALFGLTATEALIATDLGRGASTGQIVSSRGVSRNTMRTQLRSIADKMGRTRPSEIAAMVAALPPLA